MSAVRRWCLVTLGALLCIGAPVAVSSWPVDDRPLTAVQLLELIESSSDLPYSGYVEAGGGLSLPSARAFREVVDLSSSESRMRVWWRDDATWRVDRLSPTGETGWHHAGQVTTAWDYESLQATQTPDGLILLPQAVDLLPPQLAGWALDGVSGDELQRLPAERVAGREALGLRLTPAARQASIDRVDIWADAESGLPLQVEIWGGLLAAGPAIQSRFDDVSLTRPPEQVTAFSAPPGATITFGAAAGDELIGHIPGVFRIVQLAGLRLVPGHATEPVTFYGSGVTQMLVVALDDDVAEPLREELRSSPGTVTDRRGTWLSAGPLHLLLSPDRLRTPNWVLVGTVNDATLRRATREVYAKVWEVSPTD
jgi:outer membrane lipoprotein-sorting protein